MSRAICRPRRHPATDGFLFSDYSPGVQTNAASVNLKLLASVQSAKIQERAISPVAYWSDLRHSLAAAIPLPFPSGIPDVFCGGNAGARNKHQLTLPIRARMPRAGRELVKEGAR